MQVAGEAATGSEAIALVRAGEFDVVLLDISMPDKNGIDTLKTLNSSARSCPSSCCRVTPRTSTRSTCCVRARAATSTRKRRPSSWSARSAPSCARQVREPALAQILADGVTGDADKPLHGELSQREFQIFCKIAAGAAVSKIADELHLSVKTVSTYRTRVLEKMGMKSNADLTYYAIKNALVT